MSELNVDPLAEAVRTLRSQINQALAEFDKVTGGVAMVDVNVDAIESTTMADGVRTYKHHAKVRQASIEVI